MQAWRLDKTDASNLYQLSRASTITNPTNALAAARNAHVLSPGVWDFATWEAWLDLGADDRDRAIQALAPLASNPHGGDTTTRIRNAIDAIRAGKSRDDVQRLMSASNN